MMKFFYNLFKTKPIENPYFKIFKQAFPNDIDFKESKVFYLKSFEYNDSNIELFERNIERVDLNIVLENLQYNSQSNNVGIYYVVNPDGKNVIYMLSDPIELFEKEYIIKEYKVVLDENIMLLSSIEQINNVMFENRASSNLQGNVSNVPNKDMV